MRSIHLGLYALFTSAVLMVSCAEDELIENNHHLTSSETINFDAIVEWPKDYMDSRSATSSLKRVESPVLRSEEGSEILPMGVYVQDGIYPITTANPESRGAVITKGDLNSFNVWATLNKAQSVGGGSIEYIAGQEFTNTDGVFSSNGTKYYWPGEGPTIDFLAVGNANNAFVPTMTGASGTFTYTVPTAATAQNDIVVAKAASIPGNNNASVPLDFQHIMSAVNVKVGSEMTAGTINSITFKNIKGEGTYDVASGTWINVGTPTDYTVTFANGSNVVTESTADGTLINGTDATFMMIPQALTDVSEIIVNFSYSASNNTKDLTASLSGQEWTQGKTTNYYINVSPDFTLSIEEESVPIADCHYDTRVIHIKNEHSNVDWTLSSNVDWVKFRIMPDDYATNEYKDYWIENHIVSKITQEIDTTIEDDPDTEKNEQYLVNDIVVIPNPIVESLQGRGSATVIAYFYESTDDGNTNNTRKAEISLKDNKGNEYSNDFYLEQYNPLWNNKYAYERIEEDETLYPWGFASTRTVIYSYPNIDAVDWGRLQFLWDAIVWAKKQIWLPFNLHKWAQNVYNDYIGDKETARSNAYNTFKTNYVDTNTINGFITLTGNANSSWNVTLNYNKLNNIASTDPSGLVNTQNILTYGGATLSSSAEEWLINNNMVKGEENSNGDTTTRIQTAAYQVAKRKNRWVMYTTITNKTMYIDDPSTTNTVEREKIVEPTVTVNDPILTDNKLEWFLPSKDEISILESTACDKNNTNNDEALSGSYWTSTSSTTPASHNYTYTNGTLSTGTPNRTTTNKIRAARMKP